MKKKVYFNLCLFFWVLFHTNALFPQITPGDINADGKVDSTDIARGVQIALGQPPLATQAEITAGDMNSDGRVTVQDLVLIRNTIEGINRPPMADNDQAYKDEVAPLGSPFRPLYNDKVAFNGQPLALVVAETSEAARAAASLVRVEYAEEPYVTDLFQQRDAAIPVPPPTNPIEALFTAHCAVALILCLAEVEAGHMAAVFFAEPARRATITRTQVEYAGIGAEAVFALFRHGVDGMLGSAGNIFVRGFVKADMNVFATPDMVVKIVGIVAVVVVLCGFDSG